jgi:hypothetical protein
MALALAIGIGSAAGAQPASPARPVVWRAEIGGVAATALVEDGNGVTVMPRPGVFAGAGVALTVRSGLALAVGVRAGAAPLRAESSGRSWGTGSIREYDLTAGVEISRMPLGEMAIGMTATLLRGPRDVVPFRTSAGVLTWGTEAIVARRVSRRRPLDVILGARALRFPAQPRETPALHAGWVGQLRLGLRHGL